MTDDKLLARYEFDVIRDLLLVPTKQDVSTEQLPEERKWKGGCLPKLLADLVPVNPYPEKGLEGFCKNLIIDNSYENPKLVVTVANKGNVKAKNSYTEVFFFQHGKIVGSPNKKMTDEIDAGSSSDVKFDIAPNIDPVNDDWEVFIVVNSDAPEDESDFKKVEESDETNNTAHGIHVGQYYSRNLSQPAAEPVQEKTAVEPTKKKVAMEPVQEKTAVEPTKKKVAMERVKDDGAGERKRGSKYGSI